MPLSPDVANRVEQADIDYLLARVGALAALPGNPYGAAVRAVGDGWAFLVAAAPNPVFNRVMGLTPASAGALPELAAWYAEHGLPLRVDVTPAQADPALFGALTAEGLAQTGFYAGLFGEPGQPPGTTPGGGIVVEAADPAEFARIYVSGFGFPASRGEALATSVRVLAGRPDTRFLRARIGSGTAGVALLFEHGGTGYLATATTLPEYRGRGVQTALVRSRIAATGGDLVVGHTAVGGVSQRTLERCGLRLAYTKATWAPVR